MRNRANRLSFFTARAGRRRQKPAVQSGPTHLAPVPAGRQPGRANDVKLQIALHQTQKDLA
jgi:hypothetical protein